MSRLLAVREFDTNIELAVDVFGHVLCGIDRAVLSTRAAKAHHQIGEVALHISLHAFIDQGIDVLEPIVDGQGR